MKELYRDRDETTDHPSQPRGELSVFLLHVLEFPPPLLYNSDKAEQL